jgi:hypothetical protein
MNSIVRVSFGMLAASLLASHATAEWNSNAAANLAIADRGSDQNQPKVRATSDGGCYISWFDGIGTGWDVRLQKLDRFGNELWSHGGILVADLTLSSTNDYGLSVDSSDNAFLAFQDTRFGGTLITCTMVTPAGAQPWGPTGTQVSAGNGNSPHCAALGNGKLVVAWTEGSNVRRQQVDQNGVIQWDAGGMIEPTPGGNSDLICDVVALDFDRAAVSWSRNPNRFLHAQEYGPAGNGVWNAGNPVVIFDGSALQFGYFPTFVPTGDGGAVFAWYETGGTRNVYVQRLGNGGMELLPHNGVPVSTNTVGRIRLTPSVAYDTDANDTYVFWTESTSPVQNMWGVYGQRLANNGDRLWTDAGKVIVPLSGLQTANVKCILNGAGTGATVFWSDQPGSAILQGARLDSAGNFAWPGNILTACSTASGKSRLDAARSACGEALLAWSDSRNDSGDIYAQNVRASGKLGNRKNGDVNEDGVVNIDDLLGVINGWGACVTSPCLADVFPTPGATSCGGDGTVNIDDLLTTINNWG